MLFAEAGFTIDDVSERSDHDDFVLRAHPAWRAREIRARVVYRGLVQDDINELQDLVEVSSLAEAIVLEGGAPVDQELEGRPAVDVVPAPELIARFETSGLVRWDESRPTHDREALRALRAVDIGSPRNDRLGLRWLVLLARNKLPPELSGEGPPDALFERLTFRLMTHVFRFSGRRLGSASSGERVPDALLTAPAESVRFDVVLDCKASRDGFGMKADDERRLAEYVECEAPEAKYILVVSSEFPGPAGDRHPFHARRRALAERCGAKLVYVRATDLVQTALRVEEGDMSPSERERLAWSEYFEAGMPEQELFEAVARSED